MDGIGVVIADDVRARMFRAEGLRGGLEEVATLTHPEARLHERDLVTDDPGQDVSPRGREADRFAREVAEWLEQAVNDGRFRHLVICAAPKMLGRLRQKMPVRVKHIVRLELSKDLSRLDDVARIRALLPDPLFMGVVSG
jgi:protein required for attachment to host cells